jgi:hypothetical protein
MEGLDTARIVIPAAEVNYMAKKDAHWIEHMHMDKGGLHKSLNVPEGQSIPNKRIQKASELGGKVGAQARLAKTLAGVRSDHTDHTHQMHHTSAKAHRAAK